MREFFKPWRRRLGVATLVMACVFVGGWVRSSVHFDGIEIISSKSKYALSSVRGQLRCFYAHGEQARVEKREIRFPSFVFNENNYDSKFELRSKRWRFAVSDFRFMTGSESQLFYSDLVQSQGSEVLVNQTIAQVPYWSVTVPLTLLSAWLLLSKPRLASHKQPTEPAPTDGESHA